MNVTVLSSRIVKPLYQGKAPPPPTDYIPLTVFDLAACKNHVVFIYAYRPPTPSNSTLELGLQKALSVYRACAGRFGENDTVILLNDEGVRFVEAFNDSSLDEVMPWNNFSMSWPGLHPSLKGVKELVQVQLTRFNCESMVIGLTFHHRMCDANSISNFLVAWSQASRGLEISPLPFNNRTILSPRHPPLFEFDHRNVEFVDATDKNIENHIRDGEISCDVVMYKVHFTMDFLAKIKANIRSSIGHEIRISTFESVVAHLWRAITKARSLPDNEHTTMKITVNGRTRLNPRVPREYFGNLVLTAFPTAIAKDLLQQPLSYAAMLIHDAISRVNNDYIRSFIDFATYKVPKEQLIAIDHIKRTSFSPNMDLASVLNLPLNDIDFGGGRPHIFRLSESPIEGELLVMPSSIGDGGIDAFVPLFGHKLAPFKQVFYSLDLQHPHSSRL